MRLHELSIKNFRGLKDCTLHLADNSPLACLIGPGDAGKSTILTAIGWVFWPRYSLGVGDVDFYGCDTSQAIAIEATFSGFPDELIKESKYALYQRCIPDSVDGFSANDDPKADEPTTLTIRLEIDESLEPQWYIVKNSKEPKRISAADRAKIPVCAIDNHRTTDMLWGRYSLLQRFASSKEAVKATSISAARELSKMKLSDLDEVTKPVADAVAPFGVSVLQDELANRFIMNGASMPSQVGLFEGSAPLHYLGEGSRRLFSAGLAFNMASSGALILIDEIESGLEPHRLCNLISLLRGDSEKIPNASQAVFTTHSPITLQEMNHYELYAVNRQVDGKAGVFRLAHADADINDELQGQLRYTPSTFLARRIYVCEGKTELGMMKALDEHRRHTSGVGLTAESVALSDAGGSDRMFKYAKHLKEAGYQPCIFMDSDVADYQQHKDDARNDGINVFDWDAGNMTELQVFLDVTDECVKKLVGLAAELKGEQPIRDQMRSAGMDFDSVLAMGVIPEESRKVLGALAHKKSWFKQVESGKQLCQTILACGNLENSEERLYATLRELINWAVV